MATAPLEDQITTVISSLIETLVTDEDSPCQLDPVPKRVIPLYPGISVAWDECCDGQLSFQLVAMQPRSSENRGRGASFASPCSVDWWAVTIRIDLIGCTPTVKSNNKPPTPEAITKSGMSMASNLGKLVRALQTRKEIYDVGQWQPVGPEGGCVGGGIIFTMRIDAEPC